MLKGLTIEETRNLVYNLEVPLNNVTGNADIRYTGDVAKGNLVRKWLDFDTKASWEKLARGLRKIDKNCLAEEVELKHVPDISPAAAPSTVPALTCQVTPGRSPSSGGIDISPAAVSTLEATDDSGIDYKIKIALCGDSGVGKTCFVDKYVSETTNRKYVPTVGVNYAYKILTLQKKRIKIEIMDTTGQERYKTEILDYLKRAHGVILLYDVTEEDSFKNISKWLKDIQKHAANFTKIVMVGNKIDRKYDRKITLRKGGDLASSYSLRHFETSALNNENVKEAFECLALEVLDHWEKESSKRADGDPRIYTVTTDVENSKSQERRRLSCCRCC